MRWSMVMSPNNWKGREPHTTAVVTRTCHIPFSSVAFPFHLSHVINGARRLTGRPLWLDTSEMLLCTGSRFIETNTCIQVKRFVYDSDFQVRISDAFFFVAWNIFLNSTWCSIGYWKEKSFNSSLIWNLKLIVSSWSAIVIWIE